jgi:xanthine dehydrogenase YagT iron-sulfur-binding subunit
MRSKTGGPPPSTLEVSRRTFIASVGAGVVGAAALEKGLAAQDARLGAGDARVIRLRVNGRERQIAVSASTTLLEALRDQLELTGTKPGCERGECGACTVLIGDEARYACLTLALEAEGAEVTTIEGLMRGEEIGDVQRAFIERDAFQCGYCTSGQVMAVEALLRRSPAPSAVEVREGVSGNLCRCGAYPHIFDAAALAARRRRGQEG